MKDLSTVKTTYIYQLIQHKDELNALLENSAVTTAQYSRAVLDVADVANHTKAQQTFVARVAKARTKQDIAWIVYQAILAGCNLKTI